MSFQAVRAVFEAPVIDALAALATPVPCYVDNQAFTVPDAGQEYATVNLQFGATTTRVLSGNLENLRGSLVVECYTAKNTGPARSQEMITPVMQALNELNSCSGYEATGAVGWVGDMTGPAFFALADAPFYMVRLSVAVSARYEAPTGGGTKRLTTRTVKLTNPTRSTDTALTNEVTLVTPINGLKTQEDANKYFAERIEELEAGSDGSVSSELVDRLEQLEDTHDDDSGHDSGSYGITKTSKRKPKTKRAKGTKETTAEFETRIKQLEETHDDKQNHDSGNY
jgi:hypothetical protein